MAKAMAKAMQFWFVAIITGALLAVQPVIAAEGINGRLVSVQWLKTNQSRDDVLLIDASLTQLHMAKHIPGAISVDVFSFGGRENSVAEMEKRFQAWGISADKKIVIYDQGGTYMATSLFFDLYYHGFSPDNLFVLDGGLSKWQASGGAVTKDPSPAPKTGTFRVTKLKEDVRVRLPEFLVASGDPTNNALVEGLEPEQHFGAAKFFDRAGHIPNAILAPSADFFNADKTFKSAREIETMFAHLGVRPEQQIYSHCGGGIAASVPFFAAKIMLNYPKVKLYKESQLEWRRDDRGLPFWTYDAPQMTRDREWLNGWNADMLRAFGVTRLNIIDVRGAEAYKLGHIPYAVNIPADDFKRHFNSPAKLGEQLSASGVDAAQEAVIISSGGLNPASALAFLMLERMGQKRVSILLGTVDDWGLDGLPLVKPPSASDANKPTQRIAAPQTRYVVNIRPGTVINDPQGTKSTKGRYPVVYIASGKSLPAKSMDGKVIHVPYTELQNTDGTPKPAKDIWSILSKAGLTRYAEIICIADDTGEAAANYFILKLMGYPDAKVLVI